MQPSIHVCELESASGEHAPAFSKIIALGWYDGPTEGVAQCASCSAQYRFEMLDEDLDWQDGQDVRIFKLASLPHDAFNRIVRAFRGIDTPRWPVWVPHWRFESAAQQRAVEDAVARALEEAGPPECVVASRDSLQTILTSKPVSAEEMHHTQDWFDFLGLPRRESADRA